MCSAVCFCRYVNLHRQEETFRRARFILETCLQPCVRHIHCFLVWFEQFTGELAEDGQVGEVRWRRCFWGLTELLEYKLNAVPADINTQSLGHKHPLKKMNPRDEKRARADLWIMTTHSRNLTRSPKVRANLLASSLMLVNV